jgi:hypothetical protein
MNIAWEDISAGEFARPVEHENSYFMKLDDEHIVWFDSPQSGPCVRQSPSESPGYVRAVLKDLEFEPKMESANERSWVEKPAGKVGRYATKIRMVEGGRDLDIAGRHPLRLHNPNECRCCRCNSCEFHLPNETPVLAWTFGKVEAEVDAEFNGFVGEDGYLAYQYRGKCYVPQINTYFSHAISPNNYGRLTKQNVWVELVDAE